MIDLDLDHLSIVRHILENCVPECEVRVFGSRVKGGASRYLDLDLAIRRCIEENYEIIHPDDVNAG